MELKDKLARIRAKRAELDAQEEAKILKREMQVEALETEIEGMAKEIEEMCVCARELRVNKLPVGRNIPFHGIPHEEFVCGGDNEIGFYFSSSFVGIACGGANGSRLVVNPYGKIVFSTLTNATVSDNKAYEYFCNDASDFLNGFNEFKCKFEYYITNL